MTSEAERKAINKLNGALDTIRRLHEINAELRRCLGFFASVIKSGEPWTETCQREYDAIRAKTEGAP